MKQRWMLIPILIFFAATARPAGEGPRRLAVLEVGGSEKTPTALVALLEAKLLERPDRVVLLERSAVDRLLEEQALGLSNEGGLDGDAAMRAGELWGVDVFCLLSRDKSTLRLQLVDTWYGIRMADIPLPIPNQKEIEKTATMMAGALLRRLPAVPPAPEDLRMIGILDIISMEPTNRLDDLARPVRTAIEQQALHQPDLIVAEREQVRPMLEERELVDEFPERIRSSVVLVDGEFHLDTEDPTRLKLYLQGRRNGTRVFRLEVEGPLHDLNLIGNRAAKAIAEAMGAVDSIGEMDPELEADMLVAQSKASRDPASSLGAAAAARALMPDEEHVELEWLHAQYRWRNELPLSLESFQNYFYRCQRIIRSCLDAPDFGADEEWKLPLSLLSQCSYMWEVLDAPPTREAARFHREMYEFVEKCWKVYKSTFRTIPKGSHSPPQRFYKILSRIPPVSSDQGFKLYAEISRVAPISALLSISNRVAWPANLSEEERFRQNERLYQWMTSQERTLVRLAGLRGLARIHAHPNAKRSPELARKHYEAFEQAFIYQYLPESGHDPRNSILSHESYPQWIHPLLNSTGFGRAGPSRYYSDPEENLQYRADRIEAVLRQVLTDPHSPQRVDWTWFGNLLRPLNEAGRIQSQAAMIERILEYFKHGLDIWTGPNGHRRTLRRHISRFEGLYHRLREEHPGMISPAGGPRGNLQAEKVFSFEEGEMPRLVKGGVHAARRLVLEHGMAAVIFRNGILFLDPDSLRPLRFQSPPDRVRVGSVYAADESGIYTVSPEGILHFPKSGDPTVFFNNHPDLSDRYYDVDVLDGRVYLLTAKRKYLHARHALEFDLKRNTRKIIMSAESGVRSPKLEGLTDIYSVVSLPGKGRVHFYWRKYVNDTYSTESFSYDPQKELFFTADETIHYRTGKAKRRGAEVMNVRAFGVDFSNRDNGFESITRYESEDHRFDSYGPITRVGKGMLGIEPYRSELNYFPSPDSGMFKIKYDVFPPGNGRAPRLVDVATHPERGVLILASDGLYAVPTLTHASEAGTISWSEFSLEDGE